MRTQIMNDRNAGLPWFEYYQVGGSRPIKHELTDLPFVIGRDAAADFTVDSGRVSRKHVSFDLQGSDYVLRDLQSTNGTYVNGKKISEHLLCDGDVIVVADFELTFFAGISEPRATATQVMTQMAGGGLTDATDLIIQVRRLHESLTHRSITSHFQPITQLETGLVYGFEAIRELDDLPGQSRQAESIVHSTECRLTERINQQHRLYAAEQASLLEEETHLFFALKVSEVNADYLPDSLDRLAEAVAHRHQIVAEIPETGVCDIPYFRQFVADLRSRGIEVAYGGFCAGPSQMADWREFAPNYLKLSRAIVKGISRSSGGQRTVESLVVAAADLNCELIAAGVDDAEDARSLRELGCQFAQGDHYGPPEPITAYVDHTAAVALP